MTINITDIKHELIRTELYETFCLEYKNIKFVYTLLSIDNQTKLIDKIKCFKEFDLESESIENERVYVDPYFYTDISLFPNFLEHYEKCPDFIGAFNENLEIYYKNKTFSNETYKELISLLSRPTFIGYRKGRFFDINGNKLEYETILKLVETKTKKEKEKKIEIKTKKDGNNVKIFI